jgi:hypothetical protein
MHSLRPHNHRWVHLTVKHWTTRPKRPRGFRVFFLVLYQWFILPRTLFLSRYWKRSVGVFLWGKRTIDSLTFQASQLQPNAMCSLWLSVPASYTQTTPTPKSHYRQTKQKDRSTVRSTNSNDTSAAQTIRTAHRRFIRRRAWNRRNNHSEKHDRHKFLSTQADNGGDRKSRISTLVVLAKHT